MSQRTLYWCFYTLTLIGVLVGTSTVLYHEITRAWFTSAPRIDVLDLFFFSVMTTGMGGFWMVISLPHARAASPETEFRHFMSETERWVEVEWIRWRWYQPLFGTQTTVSCHLVDEANHMHSLVIRPRTRWSRMSLRRTRIGDDALDATHILSGAGPARFRTMLREPGVVRGMDEVTRSGAHITLSNGRLCLVSPTSLVKPGAIEVQVQQIRALAAAMESADSGTWVAVDTLRESTLTRSEKLWSLSGRDESATYSIRYAAGEPGETLIRAAPGPDCGWPTGLQIGAADRSPAGLPTGNPILDAHVAIQCDDKSIPARLADPELTGAILAVVKGHQGHVADGHIEIRQPDLIVDLDEVIQDVAALAAGLRTLRT